MRSTLVEKENKTLLVRTWEPLQNVKDVGTSPGGLKGKFQRGQYLLGVDLDRYTVVFLGSLFLLL